MTSDIMTSEIWCGPLNSFTDFIILFDLLYYNVKLYTNLTIRNYLSSFAPQVFLWDVSFYVFSHVFLWSTNHSLWPLVNTRMHHLFKLAWTRGLQPLIVTPHDCLPTLLLYYPALHHPPQTFPHWSCAHQGLTHQSLTCQS